MIEAINPFLNFNGDASEAVAFYQAALGAKVIASMPWSSDMDEGEVPPEVASKIMYAKLAIGDGFIELSDVPDTMTATPGTNTHVMVHCTDPDGLDRMFAALSEGGEVKMPPENMFWGARYGNLIDRFGIRWAFNCPLSEGGAA